MMDLAISIDLLITIPLLYFLLIRQTQIPKATVVPLMIVGLLIGSYFLPKESQVYLSLFKTWALPVIELSILTFIILKVRRVRKKFKSIEGHSRDFFNALKKASSDILPKTLAIVFATEIAVFYYGFLHWKTIMLKENEFTYHKQSGATVIFGILILLIGIETVAFHFLLGLWSTVAAWVLTTLSVYTAIQIFGFTKSLSKRPISIHHDRLHLNYGIMNEVEISLSDIEKIELSTRPLEGKLTKTLSPLGELESHNVILELKKEHELTGIYGMRTKFKTIGFHVDEPLKFKERMDGVLRSPFQGTLNFS